MPNIFRSKIFRWGLFLWMIIIAFLIVKILLAVLDYQQNKLVAPQKANTVYQQAQQLCGDKGIDSISWRRR